MITDLCSGNTVDLMAFRLIAAKYTLLTLVLYLSSVGKIILDGVCWMDKFVTFKW